MLPWLRQSHLSQEKSKVVYNALAVLVVSTVCVYMLVHCTVYFGAGDGIELVVDMLMFCF